jgi:Ala-tRNA(Pro) deacylase
MIASRLKDFLKREGVEFTTASHSPTYTAAQTAEAAHVSRREFAKAVMVKIDGRLAMAVLPASEKLDMALLKHAAGAKDVYLAPESEFDKWFPGCEPGAMPPFGNLYGMAVYASRSLAADEEIAFNAGSHAETMRIKYKDYDRVVQPVVAKLAAESQPFSKVYA